MTLTKSCTKCGEAKTLDQFYASRGRPAARCKVCHNAAATQRYQGRKADPEWLALRNSQYYRAGLKRKYGLTVQDVEGMLAEQEHRCGSCGDPLASGFKTHIDHCHDTGEVRSILCNHCNVALGHLRDDPERIMRLHAYAVRVCVPLKPESPLD